MYSFLQHLADDLGGLAVGLEKLLALLALLLDAVVLVEELLKESFPVELADKTVLDDVFAVVDEEMHDGLGNLVGDRLADDVEVGRDEGPDELCLHGLAICHSGFVGFALGNLLAQERIEVSNVHVVNELT